MKIEINDILELKIDDLGANGEGIAHYNDMTVFVPYSLPSEVVKAKVVHINKTLVFTELKRIIEQSPNRVEPICPIFYQCGGCSLMHLDYGSQLVAKRQNIVNVLRKNAGYTGEVAALSPSDNMLYYRNKIQLPFGSVAGQVVLGFFAENSHKIVPLTKCYLHAEWADKLIALTLAFVKSNGLTAYNEQSGTGLLRHLVARYIGGALTVTIVINGKTIKNIEKYAAMLAQEFTNVALYLSINTIRNNVIMGGTVVDITKKHQTINIMDINISVNPLSFFQINDGIRNKIYNKVIEIIAPKPQSVVIDAYSGVGLLGAIIAKTGAKVYNIEIVKEAIADANELYKQNGIAKQVTNICGDTAVELPKLIKSLNLANGNPNCQEADIKQDVTIILDPPRKGVAREVVDALIAITAPHKLIYISCNAATLSRDLGALSKAYDIVQPIAPYDMFPQTPHAEVVVSLIRK